MSTSRDIRLASVRLLSERGLSIPLHLPLSELGEPRSGKEVIDRLLCLATCGAVAYGFSKERAFAWIEREDLRIALEQPELDFLLNSAGPPERFQWQIESAYSLAWVLSLHDDMNFQQDSSSRFVFLLPNLKNDQDSSQLRSMAKLRPTAELLQATDLAYCIHLCLRDAELGGHHIKMFHSRTVEERRRALEWLFSDAGWYDVSLDT